MSKDANSFGHDKALAWESRGFVYTKRGCIVSTHPLFFMLGLYYFLILAQLSFNDTVRLKIKCSGVDSLSTLK